MPWIQISLSANKTDTDWLESALTEQGALSVTFADAGDQPVFEPEIGTTPLWEKVKVLGLFEANVSPEQIIKGLKADFVGQFPDFRIEILEDKDWVREWMDSYHPVKLGERLWICPSWHQPPEPDAVNLMLDPGLAFGTGTHPTTFLCLQWLAMANLNNLSITDYGCGSGILGIAAKLLGASHVTAIDIDPQALLATRQNAEKNGIQSNDLLVDFPENHIQQEVDLVIANILAEPLVNLASLLSSLVKPAGSIILSGILTDQSEQIMSAYRSWFSFEPAKERNGWVLLHGTRSN
jgi:ribosomal protein L11 methyltransferase